MNTDKIETLQPTVVESIRINSQLDRRVAFAKVRVGEVCINGVAVWRGHNGRLRVYWPRYWNGALQAETVELPPDSRAEIEAEVISAYRAAKKVEEKHSEERRAL